MRGLLRTVYERALPQRAKWVVEGFRIAGGPRGALRYIRLISLSADPVQVRVRALGGHRVLVRPLTSDAFALFDAFVGRWHVPRYELSPDARILDLGANIGLTAAHYAVLAPTARIVAVEMDAANAALARRNTEPWRDRIEVIDGAAWWEDGEIAYIGDTGQEYGFRIAPDRNGSRHAQAIAVNTLVERYGPIDFLKMDIEGAEREVLTRATDWAAGVRQIQVEAHGGYTAAECERDLIGLGFRTTVDSRHWASVTGIR